MDAMLVGRSSKDKTGGGARKREVGHGGMGESGLGDLLRSLARREGIENHDGIVLTRRVARLLSWFWGEGRCDRV